MTVNAKPIFAWDNPCLGATIAASTEDTDYPKENLGDARPYARWRGTGSAEQYIEFDFGAARTVTCLGIAGHNLATAGASDVVLKYWDGDSWEDCLAAFTPADDRSLFKTFASVSASKVRLYIPTGYTSAPEAGVVFAGDYLQFPSWASAEFDPDQVDVVYERNHSNEGQWLGAGIKYRERVITFRFSRLALDWVSAYLVPFWAGGHASPMFVAWDAENHASEAYYLVWDKPSFSAPYRANSRQFEMTLRGPYEAGS